MYFSPLSGHPPSTNYATIDIRNDHPVLSFDLDKEMLFRGRASIAYSGGTIDVAIQFSMDSANSGDVVWQVELERLDVTVSLDTVGGDFGTPVTGTTTVPATNGETAITTITLDEESDTGSIDGLQPGDAYRLRITRLAAGNTASGNAEVLGISFN